MRMSAHLLMHRHLQVIGEHHSFRTGKWDATQDDDDAHWGRFKRDMYLQGYSGFSRSDMPEDVVFLRLKERAIISPTCERDVSGASFAGRSSQSGLQW
jgi:hypothetical protein